MIVCISRDVSKVSLNSNLHYYCIRKFVIVVFHQSMSPSQDQYRRREYKEKGRQEVQEGLVVREQIKHKI